MRKIILALTATVAVAAPVALTATPAQAYAGTPGCVSLTEYRSITDGMTQRQVANRFGTKAHPYWGHVTWTYESDSLIETDREYKRCSKAGKPLSIWAHGGVEVDFTDETDWDWDSDYDYWVNGYQKLSSYKNRSAY